MTDEETDDWVRSEPGFLTARLELMRLYRRARRRPILTIIVALLAALGAVKMRSRKRTVYQDRLVFRVTEAEKVTNDAPPPPTSELKEYVWSIALSASRLIEVMRRHGVYANLLETDPISAVDWFRGDIGLYVWRNYYITGEVGERSARLAISYASANPQAAHEIALDLGTLIITEEGRRRQAQVESATGALREAVDVARADLDQRVAAIARLEQERAGTRDRVKRMALRVQIEGLTKSLRPASERLQQVQRQRTEAELQLAIENVGSGLRFELIDEELQTKSRKADQAQLIALGILMFILSLPIAIMAVGAFDSKIYDLDDVRRLGVPGLGHVPHFRGDHVGSLAARPRASGRG